MSRSKAGQSCALFACDQLERVMNGSFRRKWSARSLLES